MYLNKVGLHHPNNIQVDSDIIALEPGDGGSIYSDHFPVVGMFFNFYPHNATVNIIFLY